jgi:hypothetical protein
MQPDVLLLACCGDGIFALPFEQGEIRSDLFRKSFTFDLGDYGPCPSAGAAYRSLIRMHSNVGA